MVYRVEIKKGEEENFKKIALKCVQSARKSKDCLKYSFFQSIDNPQEFIVHYRFKSLAAQNRHIANLQKILGPSPNNQARDLPKKFVDLLSDEEIVLFKR